MLFFEFGVWHPLNINFVSENLHIYAKCYEVENILAYNTVGCLIVKKRVIFAVDMYMSKHSIFCQNLWPLIFAFFVLSHKQTVFEKAQLENTLSVHRLQTRRDLFECSAIFETNCVVSMWLCYCLGSMTKYIYIYIYI